MKDGEGKGEQGLPSPPEAVHLLHFLLTTVLSLTIEITQLSSQNAMVSWHQCLVWNIWIVGFE